MLKYFYSGVLLISLSFTASSQTKIRVQGYAERGGKGVKTSALVTYRLMESFPNCVVTVYLAGTTTLATIYSDSSGGGKSNPFTADSSGYYSFYVVEGTRIDIKFSGIEIPIPFTLADVFVGGSGGGGSGGITTINGDATHAQILAVGSSGSDFSISTAGGIQTFNIPTASALNRGLLSSVDWSDFNSKQNALVNSAGLLGAISDPTGNGRVVFNNNPTITGAVLITPSLGVATVSSINGLAITSGAGSILNFAAGINFNVVESGSPVMTSRTIAEGAGLAGNIYDLSSNRTLAMGTPSTITATSTNFVGGTTHTHAINSSPNPGASAAILSTNASGFLQLVRLGIGVAPTQPLEVAGNVLINSATANFYLKDTLTGFISSVSTIISPQPNNHFRTSNFSSGLVGWDLNAGGDAEFNNVTVRGALSTVVFKYNEIQATAGTFGVFKSAAKLKTNVFVASSVTYGTSTVNIDIVDQDGVSHAASNLFTTNDILRMKDGLAGDTWFKVSSVSDQTTFWRYVAIVMAGSNNVTYNAGMAVADYGQTGQGFIIQTADQANSPYLQMATHSASFSSLDASGSLVSTRQLRIGNLNSSYGFASDTYGFAAGQYGTAGKSWIIAEPSIGVRLGNNVTTRIQLAADGSGFLANGNISWDVSGVANISGWTINSTSMNNGTTYIASGFNIPAGQTAWFGKSATGFSGWSLQDASNRAITAAVANGSIYPYIVAGDGTFARIVIGGLNNTWGSDGSTNSMGMKIWSSSGAKLVEFSDVQNIISGWAIGTAKISSIGIDINSGANAGLAFGATPPTAANAGTGIWLDRTGLYGIASGVQQVKVDATTGAVLAGSGDVLVDSNGITIRADNTFKNSASLKFLDYVSGGGTLQNISLLRAIRTTSPLLTTTILSSVSPAIDTTGKAELSLLANDGSNSQIKLTSYGSLHATHANKKLVTIDSTSGVLVTSFAGASEAGDSFTASTILELKSTTGAFLPPRMTTTERDALTPAEGMVIYNLTTHKHQGYNGTVWNDFY